MLIPNSPRHFEIRPFGGILAAMVAPGGLRLLFEISPATKHLNRGVRDDIVENLYITTLAAGMGGAIIGLSHALTSSSQTRRSEFRAYAGVRTTANEWRNSCMRTAIVSEILGACLSRMSLMAAWACYPGAANKTMQPMDPRVVPLGSLLAVGAAMMVISKYRGGRLPM